MSFWLINNTKRINRIGLAAILTGVVGLMGLVPLQASALTTPPSGNLEVGSATSGNCAQVSGWTTGSTPSLQICNGQINQKWYLNRAGYDPSGNVAYTFETAKAGSFMCLNDINKSTVPGAAVDVEHCNGLLPGERFVYVNSQNGGNELRNIASGECLDASVFGAQLVLNPCDVNASSQQWFMTPNSANPQ